jgi:hypothetical protein
MTFKLTHIPEHDLTEPAIGMAREPFSNMALELFVILEEFPSKFVAARPAADMT